MQICFRSNSGIKKNNQNLWEKYCVMISGHAIPDHDKLISDLKKSARVLTISDNGRIESIIQNRRINLIRFELSKKINHDVEIIGNIKNQFPNIPIIVMNVDGDDELRINAFTSRSN